MARKRILLFWGVGVLLVLAGVSSFQNGILGIIGGIFWIFAGLLALPTRNVIVSSIVDYAPVKIDKVPGIVIAVAIILAFSTGSAILPATGADDTPTYSAEPTNTSTSTTESTSTSTPSNSEQSESETDTSTSESDTSQASRDSSQKGVLLVTVVEVVDGDTMEIRYQNGTTDTIRLLGVDTPETSFGSVSPDEFEGISDGYDGQDHLFNWGKKATTYAKEELANKEVRIKIDKEADRRG